MAKLTILQSAYVDKIKALFPFLFINKGRVSVFVALGRNWVFQGVSMMDWKELLFRLLSELIFIVLVGFALNSNDDILYTNYVIAFVLVHTIFWTFNGHFWALHIGEKRLVKNTPDRIITYLSGLSCRLNSYNSVSGCVVFGSLARNQFHAYSDIDIVISAKCQSFGHLLTYIFAVYERTYAFIHRIPVEIYCYQPCMYVDSDKDEIPIIFKDDNDQWKSVLKYYAMYDKDKVNKLTF